MAIPAIGAAPSLFVNPTGQERPAALAAQEAQEDSPAGSVAVEAVPENEEEGDASADLGSRQDADGERRGGPPGSLVDIFA